MPTIAKRYGRRNGKRYPYYVAIIRLDGHKPGFKSFPEGTPYQEAMEWGLEEERRLKTEGVPTLQRERGRNHSIASLFGAYKQYLIDPRYEWKKKKSWHKEEIAIEALEERCPEIYNKQIFLLKRTDIQDYIDKLLSEGILPSTVRRNFVGPLRSLINKYARKKLGYINMPNPFSGLDIPDNPPHRKRVLSKAEQLRLYVSIIEGCRGKHQKLLWFSIVRLALNTSLRRKPLLDLKWKNVKLDERKIWAYPTKKEPEGRWLPLSLETCRFLEMYFGTLPNDKRQPDDPVFPMTEWAHISGWKRIVWRANLYQEIEGKNWKNGQKLKDWFQFRDLRHTALTRFRSTRNGGVGLDGDQNSYMAGHIDERMTKTYEHHWDDLIADIRDKLDAADDAWKPEDHVSLPPENIAALKVFDEFISNGIMMWPNEHKAWEEAKKGLWQHQV